MSDKHVNKKKIEFRLAFQPNGTTGPVFPSQLARRRYGPSLQRVLESEGLDKPLMAKPLLARPQDLSIHLRDISPQPSDSPSKLAVVSSKPTISTQWPQIRYLIEQQHDLPFWQLLFSQLATIMRNFKGSDPGVLVKVVNKISTEAGLMALPPHDFDAILYVLVNQDLGKHGLAAVAELKLQKIEGRN
mmetsp:Transcript_14868/g.16505  ORF Transcript_14868/g.16505 Transcript_14868/m.16505 type:complete len:188 (-) Transcript_14868:36-599(-)